MFAHKVRSGLPETSHGLAAARADDAGLALWGDTERRFFIRSAAKPFQALVSQSSGAALTAEELAVAASSHGAEPVHIALVRSMLAAAGLDESALRCPPDWPLAPGALRLLVAAGHRAPRPIFHNCSGKHAAMLRACVANGWPVDSYRAPEHPLQRRIGELIAEVLGHDPGPVGVDGCGLPTYRGTVASLAAAYRRLATDADLAEVARAMQRFPALVSWTGSAQRSLSTVIGAAVKGGAEGCVGMAHGRSGWAVKCWDGSSAPAVGALVALLRRQSRLASHQERELAPVAAPPVLGGGRVVGELTIEVEGPS